MKLPAHKPLAFALLLGLMTLVGLSIVSVVFYLGKAKIEQNQQIALIKSVQDVLGDTQYDNDLLKSRWQISHPLLGDAQPKTIYRATYQGQPVATVLTCHAPDGYNGAIELVVAVKSDGSLIGVRVVSQHETPGLGDGIEVERSEWILNFNGRKLEKSTVNQWFVKRDGGAFDQLTGATITSRAVVQAVKNALIFYQNHQAEFR